MAGWPGAARRSRGRVYRVGFRRGVRGGSWGSFLLCLEVGGCRGLEDLFDGDVVLCGGGSAVFEFGCGVEDFAVAGADLDTDFSVGGGNCSVGAVEAGATLVMDSDAQGAGFAEEELLECGGVCVVAEHGDKGAEAAFLHLDGGAHNVEGAEGEGALGDVGKDLGRNIVDGGREDSDGGVSGVCGFADGEAEDVREAFGVA